MSKEIEMSDEQVDNTIEMSVKAMTIMVEMAKHGMPVLIQSPLELPNSGEESKIESAKSDEMITMIMTGAINVMDAVEDHCECNKCGKSTIRLLCLDENELEGRTPTMQDTFLIVIPTMDALPDLIEKFKTNNNKELH